MNFQSFDDFNELYEESEQEYSERMHRENCPNYLPDYEPSDRYEDDGDWWQNDCPFCDGDGCEECDETGEY